MQQYDRDTINQPLNFISQDSFFPFKLTVAIESFFFYRYLKEQCVQMLYTIYLELTTVSQK